MKTAEIFEGQEVNVHGITYVVVDAEWDNEIALEIKDPTESNGNDYGIGGDCIITSSVTVQGWLEAEDA